MPSINISHPHQLNHQQARQLAEELGDKLARKYQLNYEWQDDTLYFDGAGVDGQIDVTADSIDIQAKMSWLYTAMQGMIEKEIHRVLHSSFS